MTTPNPSDGVIGLVLFVVGLLGLVVAHSARRVLRSIADTQ